MTLLVADSVQAERVYARTFSAVASVTLPIPTGARLALLDYEFVTSTFSASVYLRPNGLSTNVLTGLHSVDYSSPSTATHGASLANRAGLPLSFNVGSSGAVGAMGRASVQCRTTGVVRKAKASILYWNTVGSGNNAGGSYEIESDVAEAAANPITSLVIVPDTGTITGTVQLQVL